ncbi:MAG: hypothetical protein ACPGVG_04550 [Mycobacterium sp.]
MRRSKFEHSWKALKRANANMAPDVRVLPDGISVDLSQPCLVFGGRNGAGKTRVLRSITALDGVSGILIDLYHLAEQALIILRSRVDFDGMTEEYTPLSLDDDMTSAVSQIVGRNYDKVEWYSFEVEPSDPEVARRFCWSGEQSLIPYFKVSRQGLEYTSRDMGLGEFCVHFLFWILEQYREEKGLTLLLDEPDAYLPSVGVSTLLQHILRICLSRTWKVVVTTHSEEMIRQAREHSAFMLLRFTGSQLQAIHCKDDPSAGNTLLASPPIQLVLYCEDESAYSLTRALLELADHGLSRATSIVWGDGVGYLVTLRRSMPRPPNFDVAFALVFDGDQRINVDRSDSRQWPAVFLPADDDPDALFKSLADQLDELADALGAPSDQLAEVLDELEGEDQHDWVNRLGERYGRQHVLIRVADLWARQHPREAGAFVEEIKAGLNYQRDGTHPSAAGPQ